MALHRVCVVALVGCVLCATLAATVPVTAAAQDEPPSVPAAYYGEVTIDGEPAATGVEIEAEVNGEIRGSITVEDPGEYGEETAGGEQLYVEGGSDDEGTPVRFYLITTDGERIEVNETDPDDITWSSGEFQQIDLSVSTGSAEQPPAFTLSEVSLDTETITEGGTVTVNANVTNSGDLSGEQSVVFSVDEEVLTNRTVDLEPNQSRSVAFENITIDQGPGNYEYAIRTDNETQTGTLTVEAAVKPVYFNVIDVDPNEPTVEQGNPIAINATIENRENVSGVQTVQFAVDNKIVADRTVEIAGDKIRTITLENDSLDLTPASYEYAIRTDNETQTGTLTIEAAVKSVYFNITDVDPNEPAVEQGNPIAINATIENRENDPGEQTVRFTVDDQIVADRTVEIAGDEIRTVTLENDSLDLTPATYEYAIRTDNETRTGTLTIEPSQENGDDADGGDGTNGGDGDTGTPSLAVSGLAPQNVTVTAGDTLTVTATIENVGDASGTQTVEYRIGGTTYASKEVTLSPGENTTVEFTAIETTNLVADDYEHGVFTENTSQTGTLTVEAETGGDTDDSTPGFGSVASLLALVLFVLLTRRQRD